MSLNRSWRKWGMKAIRISVAFWENDSLTATPQLRPLASVTHVASARRYCWDFGIKNGTNLTWRKRTISARGRQWAIAIPSPTPPHKFGPKKWVFLALSHLSLSPKNNLICTWGNCWDLEIRLRNVSDWGSYCRVKSSAGNWSSTSLSRKLPLNATKHVKIPELQWP